MSGKAAVIFCWQSGCCFAMLNGSSVVEHLPIVALDSKGWLGYDYAEILEIIRGNKCRDRFRHARAEKGKPQGKRKRLWESDDSDFSDNVGGLASE